MGFFSSSPKRKNTKGVQIRKLKSKVNKLEKKAAQAAELERLRKKYESLKRRS